MQGNCAAKVRPAELARNAFGEMELKCIFAVLFAQAAGGNRGVEQLVARRAHNPKVVSSSLAPATKHRGCKNKKAAVMRLFSLWVARASWADVAEERQEHQQIR